jgi:hypothetical protein
VPTADGVGLPLHFLDREGKVTRSFGSQTGAVRPGLGFATHRAIAPARDVGIWAGHRTQYVIELWSADGVLKRQLVRQAEWFEPYLERPVGQPTAPPPFLVDVQEISPGRIMVLW